MKQAIKTFLKAVVLIIIFVIVFYIIGGTSVIKGRSMTPNYLDGQYCISLKIIYWFSQPKRGDVVIYTSSKEPGGQMIGRIIGLPGERLSFQDGNVYINDQILTENYLSQNTRTLPNNYDHYAIGTDYYFIMGDNRNFSKDSRNIGVISSKEIKSKVLLKIGK